MSEGVVTNAFITDLDYLGAQEYARTRPSYPEASLDAVLGERNPRGLVAVDVGAGTGQYTRILTERGMSAIAIEPSPAMRAVLLRNEWAGSGKQVRVLSGLAEATGLPSESADLVVWAQCFHWLDQEAATEEAARILRKQGRIGAVWNQLRVDVPWVLRLSRVMRSGDVVRRSAAPEFGQHFSRPTLAETNWEDALTPEQILELARTRSSYIRSSPEGKQRMQANLRWYLYQHLGFEPDIKLALPYQTFTWSASIL